MTIGKKPREKNKLVITNLEARVSDYDSNQLRVAFDYELPDKKYQKNGMFSVDPNGCLQSFSFSNSPESLDLKGQVVVVVDNEGGVCEVDTLYISLFNEVTGTTYETNRIPITQLVVGE